MAMFRDKTLQTLIERATDSIKTASNIAGITERTDALVAAREENDKNFDKAGRRQLMKLAAFGTLALIGTAAAVGGLITAASTVALLAGTSGFAIPLVVAGVITSGVSAMGMSAASVDYAGVAKAKRESAATTDQALTQLTEAYPAETAKSSRLAAFLKRAFNPAATDAPKAAATAQNAPAAPATTPKP